MEKVVVGIDIGGTNTEIGVVSPDGNIIARSRISTTQHGSDFDAYLNELVLGIKSCIKSCSDNVLIGIGIGAPNGNYYRGCIEQAPNLKWKGSLPITERLSAFFPGLPIKLTNDANAAAMGEMLFGAAVGYTDFVTITLGTGVGSGIVCNGQLVYGHDGFAGEIGHTIVYPNGRLCGCGRMGCIEAYLSASGLAKTAAELMAKHRTYSVLGDIPFNEITSKDIYDAAISGDWLANEVFAISAQIMGIKLADVVATTSPKAIFFVGGVAQAGDLLLKPIKENMEKNLLDIYKNSVEILPSGLPGIDVAILGAAALVLDNIDDRHSLRGKTA